MAAPSLDRQNVAEWLARLQGTRTQDVFVEDVTAATGWNIERTRFGRYLKAKLPIGQDVVDHFNAYARARNLPEYVPTQPVPEPPPLELALTTLFAEILESRRERDDLRKELDRLSAVVDRLAAASLARSGTTERAAPDAPPAAAGSGR